VQLLLERDAEACSKDKNGSSSLSLAAKNGHLAVAQLLLGRGAEADCKDKLGRTPIVLAAENGRTAVIRLLLAEKGLPYDMQVKDNVLLMWER
jgi:ankyrin repeat protein